MSEAPFYVWAIALAGDVALPTLIGVAVFGGALATGRDRARAAWFAGAAATVVGAWTLVSALIAQRGGYHGRLGDGPPWLPIAAVGAIAGFYALTRIPAAGRVLTAPGMESRLLVPHAMRVAGFVFLAMMFLGRLPALFAIPAGLGDIATGLAAPFVARSVSAGNGYRNALWFNIFGMADLILALTLGAITGFHLIDVTPASDANGLLPLALIPTAEVPALLILHVTALRALRTRAGAPVPARVRPAGVPA
ncbi:hypothetical protein [Nocardia stercoris]|uniref:Uncharacterized protein n=1 Tax=Nocardia stercoris TaxID=2483361 RepID=A0A3M2L7I9_9NOCA|nr:hypothetical protein [Nocardia stercoris]RMI33314.1 hypothetical protein EBN03_09065 [Nocardia stercoris]